MEKKIGDEKIGDKKPRPRFIGHATTWQPRVLFFSRYGETTAAAGGVTAGASTMDTNDNVSDMMIVITDGFDGDLSALQSASAAVAADGITALGVAYDETPGILVSNILAVEKFLNRKILSGEYIGRDCKWRDKQCFHGWF